MRKQLKTSMKAFVFILAVIIAGGGCQSRPAAPAAARPVTEASRFGTPLPAGPALAAAQLPQALAGQDSLTVKVRGEVQAVCQAKGCWMDVKLADNTRMKVRFRDYGFFVPKDLTGKTVEVAGTAYREKVSVADQQHYLQDAGKSAAEIQAVTQPRQEITFVADGVLVPDSR